MKTITPIQFTMFELFVDHECKRKELNAQIATMIEQYEEYEIKIEIYSELDWHMAELYKEKARALDLKLLDLYTDLNILDGVA